MNEEKKTLYQNWNIELRKGNKQQRMKRASCGNAKYKIHQTHRSSLLTSAYGSLSRSLSRCFTHFSQQLIQLKLFNEFIFFYRNFLFIHYVAFAWHAGAKNQRCKHSLVIARALTHFVCATSGVPFDYPFGVQFWWNIAFKRTDWNKLFGLEFLKATSLCLDLDVEFSLFIFMTSKFHGLSFEDQSHQDNSNELNTQGLRCVRFVLCVCVCAYALQHSLAGPKLKLLHRRNLKFALKWVENNGRKKANGKTKKLCKTLR